jgi:hypothetical protein
VAGSRARSTGGREDNDAEGLERRRRGGIEARVRQDEDTKGVANRAVDGRERELRARCWVGESLTELAG